MSVTVRIEYDNVKATVSDDFQLAVKRLLFSNSKESIASSFSELAAFLCDKSEMFYTEEYSFLIGRTEISPDFNIIFDYRDESGSLNLSNTNFVNFMDMLRIDVDPDDLTGYIPVSDYPRILQRIIFLENTSRPIEKSVRKTVTKGNLILMGVTKERLTEVLLQFKNLVTTAKRLGRRIVWS